MPRFNHPIIQEVAALQMPEPDKIVISHGCALAIRGLRDEHADGDIDMSTSPKNVDYLRLNLGWIPTDVVVSETPMGLPITINATRDSSICHRFDVFSWDYSPERYQQTGNGRIHLDELISLSEQDETTGIWVATPELVLMTKKGSARQKDIEDIALIDAYLQQR